ncbi:LTA synthase family protein [Mesosutterella sp. AGMB02718]|uniref:LTA synthase family protein n=1 Tax=Mesosutterella faecium TaxID=2925194 RepID=A0ABT7IQN8_9BURK|nr:LTA synthase family protein [Mesosutterella sp. AGMB02718]MDL2060228.1 LTA synthase family protein [Mesosutterella sp. AGMB02718]
MKPESIGWYGRLGRAAAFLALSLAVLSALRIAFFLAYRPGALALRELLPALGVGLRFDLKWLAVGLVPAWICLLASRAAPRLWRAACWLALAAFAAMVALDLVNFGFYGFYGTPISAIIFGFVQDDTAAIVKTIWKDWPVGLYLLVLALLAALPFAASGLFPASRRPEPSRLSFALQALGGTLLLALAIRGSLGVFPLNHLAFSVSPVAFVNETVPNGAAALHEAYKNHKILDIRGGEAETLRSMGFGSESEALEALRAVRPSVPPAASAPAVQPHVIVALMESMGRDLFESHRPGINDTLGELAAQLPGAVVFKNGVSIGIGTFNSLEGLLFDTPETPITQSRFGRKTFPFSRVLAYKKAGYRTVFLTAGPESWRQIDVNFPLQGFDEIIGASELKRRYPQAESLTWGIGDAWMFKAAEERIAEADQKGEKLFLFMLSATNHGPHRVPDGVHVNPVESAALPSFITDTRTELRTAVLRTYQYACSELGRFVARVRGRTGGRPALIAATGDHNVRLRYNAAGVENRAQNGVPLLFWLPQEMRGLERRADTSRWTGHRDLFPTLDSLALGIRPELKDGRDLFGGDRFDLVESYDGFGKKGFAIGAWGAAAMQGGDRVDCYRWKAGRLERALPCPAEIEKMGRAARAEEALSDLAVRRGILGGAAGR